MENRSGKQSGTVRVFVEQFKIRDYDVGTAVVDGLTAAGFDVDIKPFVPYNERTAELNPALAYQTITVYRKQGR